MLLWKTAKNSMTATGAFVPDDHKVPKCTDP